MDCLLYTSVEKHLAENNLTRKAILVLDNASSHPANDQLKDGDIKALFLPANVTSIRQPMDQGVLQALKKKYRRTLLSYIIATIDNTEAVSYTHLDVYKRQLQPFLYLFRIVSYQNYFYG